MVHAAGDRARRAGIYRGKSEPVKQGEDTDGDEYEKSDDRMGWECQIVPAEPASQKEMRDHVSNEMNHPFLINFISFKNYEKK